MVSRKQKGKSGGKPNLSIRKRREQKTKSVPRLTVIIHRMRFREAEREAQEMLGVKDTRQCTTG